MLQSVDEHSASLDEDMDFQLEPAALDIASLQRSPAAQLPLRTSELVVRNTFLQLESPRDSDPTSGIGQRKRALSDFTGSQLVKAGLLGQNWFSAAQASETSSLPSTEPSDIELPCGESLPSTDRSDGLASASCPRQRSESQSGSDDAAQHGGYSADAGQKWDWDGTLPRRQEWQFLQSQWQAAAWSWQEQPYLGPGPLEPGGALSSHSATTEAARRRNRDLWS